MKQFVIILSIISVLFLQTAGAENPSENGSLVKGTCTIQLKIGTHQYLSKMGIAVVPEEAEQEITKIRNERWRMLASRGNYNDGLKNLDINAIGGMAVKHAVKTVQTDMEGKYEIRGLPPGNYFLYSQYRSRYAVAYWLVPLTVKSAKDEITIDINNSNMKEVYNIKKDQW